MIDGFQAMSGWEYLAVFFGLMYLVLAMKQSLWCWPAGFASTAIYTILFWQGALLMESVLNFYYLIMAIYGWWNWRRLAVKKASSSQEAQTQVVSWSIRRHAKWLASGLVLALVIGFLLEQYSNARFTYLDSFTSVFAVIATYLVTQKVLENWLYWIVIDAASIYLHLQAGYLPTAALFLVYTVLAVQGYFIWRNQFGEAPKASQLAAEFD
ncbi:nicotinamide riboside transporter PnuC [Motiliproteus sp. SC1-56]|uniref:nicotinamide riboside transporter PnuC n=1 Tax=Motiliproteus sp. SC1-56 TaxID=2799565 RepID=UPI001A8C4FC4|nr:nicotinamide riboside transporter PnuC [Motiliproteus sp. SC1-56]